MSCWSREKEMCWTVFLLFFSSSGERRGGRWEEHHRTDVSRLAWEHSCGDYWRELVDFAHSRPRCLEIGEWTCGRFLQALARVHQRDGYRQEVDRWTLWDRTHRSRHGSAVTISEQIYKYFAQSITVKVNLIVWGIEKWEGFSWLIPVVPSNVTYATRKTRKRSDPVEWLLIDPFLFTGCEEFFRNTKT